MSNNLSNTQMNVLPHEHDMSDIVDLDEALADKQDKLVEGANIHIDPNTNEISADNTEYSTATSSVAGIVKLGSDDVQTVAANAVSSTNNRTYAVQLNSNSQMVVNVPWSDTTTGGATSSVAGTVKIFSDTVQSEAANAVTSIQDRTYGLQYNSNGQLVVNVPWTDTTYTTATSSALGLVKLYSNATQTEGAQTITTTVNRTYGVQLNASNQMVVNVPWTDTHVTVEDTLSSTSTTNALSAYQGKVLNDKITDLQAMSRFLSTWNAATGLPVTFPLNIPYTYKTGDYFMVQVLPTGSNPVYMPNGVAYTGAASTTVDSTNEVKVGDFYIYDGAVWVYASNHGQTVTFTNIAGSPYDNTNLATALNAKQDTIVAGNNITIDSDGVTINAIDTTYSGGIGITLNGTTINADGLTFLSYGSSTWQDFIDAYDNHRIVFCRASTGIDPGTGTQSRLAFLTYVNSPGSPTEVEFQYYRSIASHSDSQQGDQVFVYKLTSANGGTWSVTTRETYTKITTSTGLTKSYADGTLTILNDGVLTVNGNKGTVTVNDVKISNTAPTVTEGVLWYDTTTQQLKIYKGSTLGWTRVGAVTSVNGQTGDVIIAEPSFEDIKGSPADNAALAAKFSEYVDKVNSESINGTKTFQQEIVLPNKTTDATNNGTAPATEAQVYKKADQDGIYPLMRVGAANNLYTNDNVIDVDTWNFRTTAGSESVPSEGTAQVNYILGNSQKTGYIPSTFTVNSSNGMSVTDLDIKQFTYAVNNTTGVYTFTLTSGSWDTNPTSYGLTVSVQQAEFNISNGTFSDSTGNIFKAYVGNNRGLFILKYNTVTSSRDLSNGTYTWSNASTVTFGITTPSSTDIQVNITYIDAVTSGSISVDFTAENRGTIEVAKPYSINATGVNQYGGILNAAGAAKVYNATIDNSGKIVSGNNTVVFVLAYGGVTNGYMAYSAGGYLVKCGWTTSTPQIGVTLDITGSNNTATTCWMPYAETGFFCVELTNDTGLSIHPRWSNQEATNTDAFDNHAITLPTTDTSSNNLPLATYGMPKVGSVADEMNFQSQTYIQRIGRQTFTYANLQAIIQSGVDYDYDTNYIYYVLEQANIYDISVSKDITVADYGTEYFIQNDGGTQHILSVPVRVSMSYGSNLVDKLRTGVVINSSQANNIGGIQIRVGTEQQYNALGTHDNHTLYFTKAT